MTVKPSSFLAELHLHVSVVRGLAKGVWWNIWRLLDFRNYTINLASSLAEMTDGAQPHTSFSLHQTTTAPLYNSMNFKKCF